MKPIKTKGLNKTTLDWLLNMSEPEFAKFVLWVEKARYDVRNPPEPATPRSHATSTPVHVWSTDSTQQYMKLCAYAAHECQMYKSGLVVELRVCGDVLTAKYFPNLRNEL